MPIPLDPPRVPQEDNPTGLYRTTFAIPDDWYGRRIFINFEGVESAFYLWINGQFVGYSQGSRLPAEFDLTDFVSPGENSLAAMVIRWSDGSLPGRPGSLVDGRHLPRRLSLCHAAGAHSGLSPRVPCWMKITKTRLWNCTSIWKPSKGKNQTGIR